MLSLISPNNFSSSSGQRDRKKSSPKTQGRIRLLLSRERELLAIYTNLKSFFNWWDKAGNLFSRFLFRKCPVSIHQSIEQHSILCATPGSGTQIRLSIRLERDTGFSSRFLRHLICLSVCSSVCLNNTSMLWEGGAVRFLHQSKPSLQMEPILSPCRWLLSVAKKLFYLRSDDNHSVPFIGHYAFLCKDELGERQEGVFEYYEDLH